MKHIFTRILGGRYKQDPAPKPTMPEGRQPETVYTDKKHVTCDGPEFSRHPRIYLDMGDKTQIYCPYCSRLFVYDK